MEVNFKRHGKPGTWTAGNPLVLRAGTWAYGTTYKSPHGLGRDPDYIKVYLENRFAEGGYVPGDRIHLSESNMGDANNTYYGFMTSTDFGNIYLTLGGAGVIIMHKTSGAVQGGALAASWDVVMIPYKVN